MCLSIQSTSIITVNGFKDTTTWKPSTCQMQTDTNSGLDKIGPSSHINLHIVTSTVPDISFKAVIKWTYLQCMHNGYNTNCDFNIYLFICIHRGW